jgi:cyclic-di-GMP phosphodiesterase TipF (flagellum assembly factor)
LLLNRSAALAANIDPAELVAYLNGFGIDLIAEKIERESVMVDLLDCEVKLGQGTLFSPPRPARADAPKETKQLATHETPVAPNAPDSVSPPAIGEPSTAEGLKPTTAIGEPSAAAPGRGRRRSARARRAPDMPARN